MTTIAELAAAEHDRLLELIRELVAAESPSDDPAALEACAAIVARHLREAGAQVARHGTHVTGHWPGRAAGVLLLGHFDTVWPVGQIRRQPIDTRDGRLFGPGVLDMKAGLSIAIAAMRVLCAGGGADSRPSVTLLATSDEEVGSGTSRALIEQLARQSDAVLVFEPALPGGGLKTARKGVGEFTVTATGVSSHAGGQPELGASAITEIAHQVLALQGHADTARGLSVNVGVIHGGTRSNVVAESARAVVDVRIARLEDASAIEKKLRGLAARDPRVTLTVTGGINRPPMERTAGVERLFRLAQSVASEMGQVLTEGSTGGASDGNFSAALGVPTLDGLGALGDGPHAIHEHVIIKDLVPRVALAAGLIARLGDTGIK
ncbi:MAG TPA: M20 family metallopeptidase [Vicinamibacterales bacterium]|nr:M20 family metallopeptidase [Vicinamibacterales bacterium]